MTEQTGLLLPHGARLIHIGHPKSGSTALQVALRRERATLPAHGVVYPGRDLRSASAGWAVLGLGPAIGRKKPTMAQWETLVEEVSNAGDARVCISNEDFSRASAGTVSTVVDGLGGELAHVVLVARRLDKLLPSQWQERVKAREVLDYDSFLRSLLDPDAGRWANRYPWAVDLPGLVGRWVDVVGPDRFTLVVADEQDHGRVPDVFEQMLGLPAGTLAADPQLTNRGLSLNETEWVRELNALCRESDLSPELYHQLIQSGLLSAVKRDAPDATDVRSPALPGWAAERVAELDAERMTILDRHGIRVVGELEGLRSPLSEPSATGPGVVSSVPLAVAARGLHGVLEAVVKREQRLARKARKDRKASAPRTPSAPLLSEASGRELLGALRVRATGRLRRR